jgi:hypothetical protein
MATQWKAILIRFVEGESNMLKEYCRKNHVKMAELFRNAVRLYVANPDLVNGIVRVRDDGIETEQVLKGITELAQKLESLEKKLNSYPTDGKFTNSVIKARITECILKVKQKNKKEPITVDNLQIQLKKMDPSLAPYLVASATNGFSLFDEVLMELQGRELNRDFNEIINFIGD